MLMEKAVWSNEDLNEFIKKILSELKGATVDASASKIPVGARKDSKVVLTFKFKKSVFKFKSGDVIIRIKVKVENARKTGWVSTPDGRTKFVQTNTSVGIESISSYGLKDFFIKAVDFTRLYELARSGANSPRLTTSFEFVD